MLQRVLGCLREYNQITSSSSQGGRLLELEGVTAAILPAVGEHALLNSVVYDDPGSLEAALEAIARAYDAAGVERWLVYAPAVDRRARSLLKRAGHRLSASPTAMGRPLDGVERPPEHALEEWTAAGDPDAMAALCDRAFRFGTAFKRTFADMPESRARVYMAHVHGEPISCVLTSQHEGNCAVHLLATLPQQRRRGVCSALLGHALADAAEAGCGTATVVVGRRAVSLCKRLGFTPVCPLQKWVRQRPAP
jgi:GNAT superfamily N-acetyltransferase